MWRNALHDRSCQCRRISGILPPSIQYVTGGQASGYAAANLSFMVNWVRTTVVNIKQKVDMRSMRSRRLKWRWVPRPNVMYLVLVLTEQC